MCSFTIISKLLKNNKINNLVKNRGPDYTNIIEYQDFIFYHNLLHITGKYTIQPLIKDNVVVLFNGEIYNYKNLGNFDNELELLHNLYLNSNLDFVNKLDGEFVIIIFDLNKRNIIFISDLFSTKPLWYTINNKSIMISSYKKEILENTEESEILKLEENIVKILDLDNFKIINSYQHTIMNLNQYKDNYDDWNKAFEEAVLKRIPENDINYMVPISSGHDSGCIACVLNKYNKNPILYSIDGGEDRNIVKNRLSKVKNNKLFFFDNKMFFENFKFLIQNGDFIFYQAVSRNSEKKSKKGEYWYMIARDGAAIGLNSIIQNCKELNPNFKVLLSGDGADEIYFHNSMAQGKKYGCGFQPDFFPENLNDIYPWYNLYKGSMRRFIDKTEFVGGVNGIESRYPFLDKKLFQEFLNLKPELKNKYYKGPIEQYLKINNYPLRKDNFKLGMNPLRNITNNTIQKLILDRTLNSILPNIISSTESENPRSKDILYREKWINSLF